MIFKELFDKEFLFESKKDAKLVKIFYKFDINIIKPKAAEPAETQPVDPNQQPPATPVDTTAQLDAQPEVPVDTTTAQQPAAEPAGSLDLSNIPLATVVTEDDKDEVKIQDEDSIVRKLEGEIPLPKEEVDNIQTIDDLVLKLTEEKKDGVEILDEFSAEILNLLLLPPEQASKEIQQKVDKSSSIFAEVMYGKKLEDSVGVRMIKRKNSELVTTTIMIDNKVYNTTFKKEIVDERITDYRNNEFED